MFFRILGMVQDLVHYSFQMLHHCIDRLHFHYVSYLFRPDWILMAVLDRVFVSELVSFLALAPISFCRFWDVYQDLLNHILSRKYSISKFWVGLLNQEMSQQFTELPHLPWWISSIQMASENYSFVLEQAYLPLISYCKMKESIENVHRKEIFISEFYIF